MEIIGALISLTIFVCIVGAISVFIYKAVRGKNAEPILWNQPVQFRANIGWLLAAILIGYHIGIHSSLFVSGPIRFPAVGWAVLSITAALGWLYVYRKRLSPLILSLVMVIAIAGIFIPLRANGFVQSFNSTIQILASLILTAIIIHEKMSWTISNLVRTLFSVMPLSFVNGIRIVRSLFSRDAERSQKVVGWIKTMVIMFVALIVFITILSNADPVFSNIIEEFRSQLFERTIASIIILLILASILSIARNVDEEESAIGWLSYRDMFVSTAAVSVIIVIFLSVQFQYLFLGSGTMLRDLGLSFSEYVRKGFNELLVATFIGGIMAYLIAIKGRQSSNSSHQKWAKLLNIILLAELALLLVSALKRDLLYVDTYGLTRVRIVGGVFLLWLFGFLVTLACFSLFKKMKESKLLTTIWILTIAAWIGLNTFNIDRIVVNGAPEHHQYTDYFYLMQLSEDAQAEKINLLPLMQTEVDILLKKPRLTDVEKSQLAGLKLAILTFAERRDRLYLLYSEEAWLLQNGWRIGQQFADNATDNYYISAEQLNTTAYATNWQNLGQQRKIPKNIKKQRQIAQYNKAEAEAFKMLKANERIIFEPVEKAIRDIRYYQIENQVPLYREENRLLREFNYPFLNVQLNRYYPEEMQRVSPSNRSYNKVTWPVFENIDKQQTTSPKSLAYYSCATVPENLETFGIIKYGNPAILETIAGEPSNVTIIIPSDIKLSRPSNNSVQSVFGTSRPIYSKPSAYESTDWGYGEGVIAKLSLKPNKTISASNLCSITYTINSATEYVGF